VKYTFIDFDRQMGDVVRVAAAPARRDRRPHRAGAAGARDEHAERHARQHPDYLPGGGSVEIASVDPNTGRVALTVPGMDRGRRGRRPGGRGQHQAAHQPGVAGRDPHARQRVPERAAAERST
jgi:hypothetical protein